VFCREAVAQLRDHEEEIRAAGADIATIGTGGRAYAQDFKAERKLDFPVLLDPALATYGAVEAGTARLTQLVTPGTVKRGVQALTHRNVQGRTGKHPLKLGATHVIRPDGSVPFAWRNDDVADDPRPAQVIEALS
jgi:peroxiredoxin